MSDNEQKAKSVEYLAKRLGTSAELLDETAHMRVMTSLECITDLQDEKEKLVKENEELRETLDFFKSVNYNPILPGQDRLSNYSEGYNAALKEVKEIAEQALKKCYFVV